jgi:peptidoglycan/LPS O-acetylase OafA/YrhL
MTERTLEAVDFIRSLMSIWVVGCHVTGLLSYLLFFTSKPNQRLMNEFLSAWWPNFVIGLGYQVDVFFVISGFLLTWKFLSTHSKNPDALKNKNIVKEVFLQFWKRVFRLWPVTLGATILSLVFGDYGIDSPRKILELFTYPSTAHGPMATGIQWSNRMDTICSTILFIVCYLLEYWQLWSYWNCLSLVFLSFLPKIWRFATVLPRISYLKLKNAGLDLMIPAYMVKERIHYYHNVLYPGKCLEIQDPFDSPLKLYVMKWDYLVFHQRIPPFFIGLFLAYVLHQEYMKIPKKLSPKDQENDGKTQERFPVGRGKKFLHGIYLFLSLFMVASPLLLSILGKKLTYEELQEQSTRSHTPEYFEMNLPFGADFFVSAVNRPLYATAWAYLIYRFCLPAVHPLALSVPFLPTEMKMLFSSSFGFLAENSFAIYCVHMKVMMEVMWNYFPPMDFQNKSLSEYFLFTFAIVFSFSLLVGMAIHYCLEIPLTNYLFQPLLKYMNSALYKKNRSSNLKEMINKTE